MDEILTPGLKAEIDRRVAEKTIARLRMDYNASQAALSDCLTEHRVLVERIEALIAIDGPLGSVYDKPALYARDILRDALAAAPTGPTTEGEGGG